MSAIAPFRVCTDVELGPPLPAQPASDVSRQWSAVPKNKNKDTTNSAKKKQQHPADPYQLEGRGRGTTLEAQGELECKTNREGTNIVFSDFATQNMLAKAVHVAFYEHYPLRLSPDAIWLTIIQGLANHIDENPEAHRSKFVNFEGKKQLVISRPDFVKGSTKNDWTKVFPEFTEMIAKYIGNDMAATLTNDFSTSSPTDRICSNIALMDTVKHYFEYEMMMGCGIPSIELTGTSDDWIALKNKAEILNKFDLGWWTDELFPVLDQFIAASKGSPDIKFWKNVCNLHGASGFWAGYVTGWVQVFFPYLNNGHKSHDLGEWREHYEKGSGLETEEFNEGKRFSGFSGWFSGFSGFSGHPPCGYGLELTDIPCGISQAPFVLLDLSDGREYDMTFNGGLVAVLQDKQTLALEPVTGWAVLDHGEL